MPTLDARFANPLRSGGTIDTDAEMAIPTYRDEPFQITAAKPLPINMRDKPRPVTHHVNHQLHAGRTQVLRRNSNINPDAAGAETLTGVWGISDPDTGGLAQEPGSGSSFSVPIGVMLGAAVGLGLFLVSRRR